MLLLYLRYLITHSKLLWQNIPAVVSTVVVKITEVSVIAVLRSVIILRLGTVAVVGEVTGVVIVTEDVVL